MAENRYRQGRTYDDEPSRRRSDSIFDDDRDRSERDRGSEQGFFQRARDWFSDEANDRASRRGDYRDEEYARRFRSESGRYRGPSEYSGGTGGAFGSVGGASRDYGTRAPDRDEDRDRDREWRRHPQTIRNEPSGAWYGEQGSRGRQQDLGEGEIFRRGQSGGRWTETRQRSRPFGNNRQAGVPRVGWSDDEQYRNWRDQQIADLDRDYEEYRRERQQQFDREFDSWRQQRQGRRTEAPAASQSSNAPSDATASRSASSETAAGSSAGTQAAGSTRSNRSNS